MVQHCAGGLDAISMWCRGMYGNVCVGVWRERNEVQTRCISNHDATLDASIYKHLESRRKMHWPTMATGEWGGSFMNAIDHQECRLPLHLAFWDGSVAPSTVIAYHITLESDCRKWEGRKDGWMESMDGWQQGQGMVLVISVPFSLTPGRYELSWNVEELPSTS